MQMLGDAAAVMRTFARHIHDLEARLTTNVNDQLEAMRTQQPTPLMESLGKGSRFRQMMPVVTARGDGLVSPPRIVPRLRFSSCSMTRNPRYSPEIVMVSVIRIGIKT